MRLLRALSLSALLALPAAGCASANADLGLWDEFGDSPSVIGAGVTCRQEQIGKLCMTRGQWNLYESRGVGYYDYD